MKQINRIRLGIVFILIFSSTALFLCAERPLEPVGLWKPSLSGTKDLSGHSLDGSLNGNKSESPFEFTGLSENVFELPITQKLNQAFSLSFWIYPLSVNRSKIMGSRFSNESFETPSPGLFFREPRQLSFASWDQQGVQKINIDLSNVIRAQTWTLVTLSYDKSKIKLYFNQTLVGQTDWSKGFNLTEASRFRLGSIRDTDRFFKGQFGEVRLYDQAISQQEIDELYQKTREIYPDLPGIALTQDKTIIIESKNSPKEKEWKKYPSTTLHELEDFKKSGGVMLDQFGGRLDKKSKATGNFYATNEKGRWWLVDPAGGYFLHAAIVNVAIGTTKTAKENFGERFGTKEKWAEDTAVFLKDNGFNGTGAWSDVDLLKNARQKVVYTVFAYFMATFAGEKKLTRPGVGHTGFLHDSMPVFHPEFVSFCELYAEKMITPYKNDPWCLGYFSDNELLPADLKKYLLFSQTDPDQAPNYQAAHDWLVKQTGNPEAGPEQITPKIKAEFAGYVLDIYYGIVSKAIKKVDSKHLYIGSRLDTEDQKVNPYVWKAAGKYLDVISLNLYRTWTPDLESVNDWNTWSGKPVIITEWYVKGDDVGFPNTTGAGWLVKTQEDRGNFYQQFVINALRSKGIVGWHWFKYMDNDPNDPKAEPSNKDSNKGVMKLDYTPYTAVMDKMKEINIEMYPLVDYLDAKK